MLGGGLLATTIIIKINLEIVMLGKDEVLRQKLQEQFNSLHLNYVQKKNPKKIIKYIKVTLDGDFANLEYEVEEEPFDRIRRITGYLVGDTRYWNNAKRSEERDRVKHRQKVLL